MFLRWRKNKENRILECCHSMMGRLQNHRMPRRREGRGAEGDHELGSGLGGTIWREAQGPMSGELGALQGRPLL